jgi:hypothetical protein
MSSPKKDLSIFTDIPKQGPQAWTWNTHDTHIDDQKLLQLEDTTLHSATLHRSLAASWENPSISLTTPVKLRENSLGKRHK